MRIAIFGAGGFIGSNLVEFLSGRGEHELIAVDRTGEKLEGISGFTFYEADIAQNGDLVEKVVRTADVVVDLVAHANPSLYVSSPLDVVHVNLFENLKIVESCIQNETRLIQYSTCEVYGKPNGNASFIEDESDFVVGPVHKQRWIYAQSKQLLERIIHAHGEAGDLDYTVLRPFNLLGPRQDYLVPAGAHGGPRVFAHFMSALLTGGPMFLVDGGAQRRCFLHIQDANTAFQTVLDHPDARKQIFNVGNPDNDISIRELALLIGRLYEEATGKDGRRKFIEVAGEDFYGPGYEDASRVPPDIFKLEILGWKPRYDIVDTVRDAIGPYITGEVEVPAGFQRT